MVVAIIMDKVDTFVNHPHSRHHHYGGNQISSSAAAMNTGGGPFSPFHIHTRKERQSSSRMNYNHHYHIPMDTSCSPSGTSVTTTDSTCCSGSTQLKSMFAYTTQSFDGYGGNHGSRGSVTKKRSFREFIEMLLYCYLEYGTSVKSEEFKNLVEAFLCPIFEPLQVPNRRTSLNGNSCCGCSNSLPSTSSFLSGTSCVATCMTSSPLKPMSGSAPVSCSGESGTSCSSLSSGSSNCKDFSGANSDAMDRSESGWCNRLLQGDFLSCPSCYGVLIEPVTISCGHTYCKKCLQKETVGHRCRRCSHILTSGDISQSKINVLVGSLVEKWWAHEVEATNLRNEGNALFQKKKVEEALVKYTQALNLSPDDHLSFGNRSHALLTAGKSEQALQDADAAIRCCPTWTKGYFRKSAALISLGRYEEAFLSLTYCMYLIKVASSSLLPVSSSNSSSSSHATSATPSSSSSSSSKHILNECIKDDPARTQIINEMIKILQKIFLQTSNAAVGSILKRHNTGEQIQFTPYPNGRNGRHHHHHHERRRPVFSRTKDWNDSECTSSGDESDNQPYLYSDSSASSESNSVWAWKSQRSYPSYLSHPNQSYHHGQHKHYLSPSLSSSPVVDQLSGRMNRLLTRAGQDLKSFELRLKDLHQQQASSVRSVEPKLIASSDVECSLCYRLLFQPVSTCCGHTFCRSCLERCLDHNPSCPLCKTSLQSYLASREHAINEFLEVAIQHYLPKEREERLKQHLEELNSTAIPPEGKNVDVDIPIFVCTMAFPTIPCPLHVFEPRYRLMIRRCMENGSNRFGMCCYLADAEHNYGEIGTLLEIKNIQYFADGRSVVDTVGCRRFRVLRKTVVDGYNAAKIELLHDQPVQPDEIPVVSALHDKVFKEASAWLQSIGQVRRQRILSHFGLMPTPEENWLDSPDGPSWIWWLLAILPLDSKAQLSILSMTSLQKRLDCILKVLTFVKNRMSAIVE